MTVYEWSLTLAGFVFLALAGIFGNRFYRIGCGGVVTAMILFMAAVMLQLAGAER